MSRLKESVFPLLSLALASLSGLAMAVQGALNAALGKALGVLEATFIVHITGTVLIAVLLLLRFGKGQLWPLPSIPWYYYAGGLLGVVIVYLVVISIPALGMSNATTAIIVGQIITAWVIDYFGLFGMARSECGFTQIFGLFLLAVGAKLLLK